MVGQCWQWHSYAGGHLLLRQWRKTVHVIFIPDKQSSKLDWGSRLKSIGEITNDVWTWHHPPQSLSDWFLGSHLHYSSSWLTLSPCPFLWNQTTSGLLRTVWPWVWDHSTSLQTAIDYLKIREWLLCSLNILHVLRQEVFYLYFKTYWQWTLVSISKGTLYISKGKITSNLKHLYLTFECWRFSTYLTVWAFFYIKIIHECLHRISGNRGMGPGSRFKICSPLLSTAFHLFLPFFFVSLFSSVCLFGLCFLR